MLCTHTSDLDNWKSVSLSNMFYDEGINDVMVLSVEQSFSYQEDGSFLIAILLDTDGNFDTEFGIEDEESESDDGNNEEDDDPTFSAIARIDLDHQSSESENQPTLELGFIDLKRSSALIKAQVFGILEYESGKVLITHYPSTILIIDNWAKILKIEDPRSGND